jgi:hypothetical protein
MAKITRKNLNVFGLTGSSTYFGEFGSQAAASPVETKDIDTIQQLGAWSTGWQDAVALGEAPYLQDMNGWMYVHSYEVAYLLQEGVAEWNTDAVYYTGSIVKKTGTFELYGSLGDTNTGNALPSRVTDANWQYLGLLTNLPSATASYRRPNLVYASATTVTLESGINGTSGAVAVLFPDMELRVTSSATLTTLDMTRVAVLTGGGKQSGLRTGSVANNSWYAVYAVKSQDTSDLITVADVVLPLQANYATLNSNFGARAWRYLGMIRCGNGDTATSSILKFRQTGAMTTFRNAVQGNTGEGKPGMLLAGSASGTSATWSYSAGTAGAVVPNNILMGTLSADHGGTATTIAATDSAGTVDYGRLDGISAGRALLRVPMVDVTDGFKVTCTNADTLDVVLSAFVDNLLTSDAALL